MEPKIIGYKYEVVAEKASLLIGENLDSAEDIDGWNINLIKYELWDDDDKIINKCITITHTRYESQVEYLKDVVKASATFMLAFRFNISTSKAYEMFM